MDSFDFQVEIKYTRRQGSVGFKICDGGVRLLAPKHTPLAVLRSMVNARQQWIQQKLAELKATPPRYSPPDLISGTELRYLGNTYPLSIVSAEATCVELDSGYLCVDIPEGEFDPKLGDVIEHWFKQQAQQHFPERLKHWSDIMQLSPASLKVKRYKSRWGSCDQRQRITLNSRLMMASEDIIDYVIIHELSHMLEMNHSAAFWFHVERYCPDYRERRRWLKRQGHLLQLT
ncbi:MAG: SprT family zinc-dependent metalloprotease [Motiliproteus sp.]